MAYDKSINASDVAGKLIDALRQDKKNMEMNAVIQAEIDQASFKKAEKQIDDLSKPREVDIKVKKSEKNLDNLLDALKEVQTKLKEISASSPGFTDMHRITDQYENLKISIDAVSKSVSKNNQAFKESQKIIRDTDKMLNKLNITQEKVTKTKSSSYKNIADDVAQAAEQVAQVQEQAAKTTIRTQAQVNVELDKELQKLKEIEAQQAKNSSAREKLKRDRANYGKEFLGTDRAVYDTDLLKGARKELQELNQMLETRNKFQEKYIKLCNIISNYYVDDKPGKHSIGNGLYKNLDAFFLENSDISWLEDLNEKGQKTTNKVINEAFKNIIRGLQADINIVSDLIRSGEVVGDMIGQNLDREESQLNKEMQELYEAREAQLKKINALRQEEINLIKQAGQEEAKVVAIQGKKALNMESVIKRYNKLMNTIGKEHRTIGTVFSQGTENFNITDMVNEAEYWLDAFKSEGPGSNDLDEVKIWKSELGKLSRFIDTYKSFTEGITPNGIVSKIESEIQKQEELTDAIEDTIEAEKKLEATRNAATKNKSSKIKVREYAHEDEYYAYQDKYRDEHDGESEYLENVIDIMPRLGQGFSKIAADMTTSCKKAETAVQRFFSAINPEKYPELAEWESFIKEGMENGLFKQSDPEGGWSWEVQALDDNTYYVSLIAVADAQSMVIKQAEEMQKKLGESASTPIKTDVIDEEELEIIQKENGALEDRLELLQDIAEQYANNVSQRDRNRFEELNQKDMDSGLTSREEERYWELGEAIDEADQQLEEFGKTYERIILKLGNGKKIEILPDDAGLKKFDKIANEYYGGEYNGVEIQDVIFERVKATNTALLEQEYVVEKVSASQVQDNKKIISSYEELLDAVKKYIELAKQLKSTSTPEYDKIQEAIDDAGYVDDKDEAIAEIKAWYTNVQRIKSSQKQGLSVYKHMYTDGEEIEFRIGDNTLQEAQSRLNGYIYRAVEYFGYTVADVMNDFSAKRMRTFIEGQINKYLEINAADDAYRIDAIEFNLPIEEAMEQISSAIISAANDVDKSKAQDLLDELSYRANSVNRYTLSRQTNYLGGYMGITTPDDEIQANAKKIESYEELCDVIARYHKLQRASIIYGGDNSPGLNEDEEKEYRELRARLIATGGQDVWQLADFGEFKDIDKLANTLGIEVPRAVDEATEAIKEENKLFEEQAEIANSVVKQIEAQADAEKKVADATKETLNVLKDVNNISTSEQSTLYDAEMAKLVRGTNIDSLLKQFVTSKEDRAAIREEFYKLANMAKTLVSTDVEEHDDFEIIDDTIDDLIEYQQNQIERMIREKGSSKKDMADDMYEAFYQHMKGIQIRYHDEDVAEYGDDWKRIIKQFGSGKYKVLTKDSSAMGADQVYMELLDNFPGLFDADTINSQDQLVSILSRLQQAREERKSTKTGIPDEALDYIHEELNSFLDTVVINASDMRAKAAKETDNTAKKFANTLSDLIMGNSDDGAIEPILDMANQTKTMIELISSAAGKSAATKFLEGITSETDLENRISGYFNEVFNSNDWKFKEGKGALSIKGDTLTANLVNSSQDALQAVFKLDDGVLKLQEDLLKLDVANNVKVFDADSAQKLALSSIEKIRADAERAKYDLSALETQAKAISSSNDITKFNAELKNTQNNIQAIKNSTATKSSMNPLINMQRDMKVANTELDTMQLKLDKLGKVDGVKAASDIIANMRTALEDYNKATTSEGQQKAYNDYSDLRHSFKAQMEYINAAKALTDSQKTEEKKTDPIREQYQSILDLVNKINVANERMIKFQSMDGGSGLLGKQIGNEQQKKLEAVEKLNSVMAELKVGDVLGKDQYSLPDDIASIGTDYSQIAAFINDAGVQSSLTTTEIEKLVNALQKAEDIDLSMLSEALGNESIKARAKQTAYENKYFSDKTKVSVDVDGNTNLKIEDIQKLGTAGATTKEKLEGLAQTIAQNSEGAVALTKNFSMGADGIAKLDFSILNTNTGSIKDFTIALGTATGQVAVFDTTVDKSIKNVQKARSQIEKSQNSLDSFGFGDVGLKDTNAPTQVTNILRKIEELRIALEAGDENLITQYTKDLAELTKGFEKAGNQAYKMKSAIENGTAYEESNINPNGDIYGQLTRRAQEYAAAQGNVTLEVGSFDKTTNTLSASLVHANGTVEQLKFTMYGLGGEVARQQVGVGKLTTSWDRFKTGVSKVGKHLMTALVGYNAFFKVVSEVRKGIGYVKEIDLALTELKKVTDETEESYKKFLNTAASTAGEIGSTVSDFTEASANFARLGYTMEESADMAKTAIVYKNVADGLDTVDEATDSIISTMKAFGIESDNTMQIIDVFNEVGNNFAITSAGIGEAMQRSASALYAAGNTFEESTALITAANSVIQNPEQVGTALKTLSLRLRGAKVELEEAGLETDNMAESTSTLQEKLKALTHGKVDIMLDADTFKNTTQILREMSAVWEDMTDIERASALELMGGKRQANILASLITNFETVEDVIESSMNSSGSALAENAKWMDSIEGKSITLTNAMQALWNETINSDVIKFFLDLALGATEVVGAFGPWKSALAAILVYFTAFKKNNPVTIFKDFGAHISNFTQAAAKVQALQSLKAGSALDSGLFDITRVNAYATAVSGLTTKQQALMLATKGLTQEQIHQVLSANGVADADARIAIAEAQVAATKTQVATITGEQMFNIAAETGVKLSNEAITWLANNAEKEFTKSKLKSALASDLLQKEDRESIMALFALSGATKGASMSFKALGTAMSMAFKSNPIGMILSIATGVISLISVVNSLKKSTEELAQTAEEAVTKYKESQQTLQDQKKTIDELSASYEKLSQGVDLNTNENINLTTDSYEEYLDVCNEIADMYPNLVIGFDAQGNAILSLKGNIDELIESYRAAAQAARQQMIAGGGDIWDTFKTNYDQETFWGIDQVGLKHQRDLAEQLLNVINTGSDEEINDFLQPILSLIASNEPGSISHSDLKDMMESAAIEKFYKNIWYKKDMTDPNADFYEIDISKLKQQSDKLASFIKSSTTQINTETSKVKSLMDAYLGEDLDYTGLSAKSRAFVNQIVSGLDAEFIAGFDSADALYNHIKTNIIDVFKDPSVTSALSDLSELQLEFADGDITYADYRKQLTEILGTIQNKFDEETLSQVKVGIGIDETALQTAVNHALNLLGGDDRRGFRLSKVWSLSVEDLQIAGQLEVPEGTTLSWDELIAKIEEAKIAATADFDITNYTDAISSHSAVITEYQEALQKLGKGSFTMDDFMELIKKYPELAKGVDISSNAFYGLSRNLNGAIKTSTKNFIKDLKELRVTLVAAGKSTDSIDQLIQAIENMPDDALDDTIQKYSTLSEKIDKARLAQDKLLASMEENPNEGYETRGEAMEYMKEAMEKGEIGSESNLWNVAKQYGFTYDSAKSINENADALAKFIAIREKWFKQDDDGDSRTDDGYSYKGTESFIKDVESAVQNNSELQQYLTWDYDESAGTLNFDYNNEDWDTIVSILSKTKELAGLTSDEFADMMVQIGQYFGIDWGNYDDVLSHLNKIATGTSDAKTKVEEYGKAMQDHFGEDTTVDLTTRPMVKFDSTNFKEWEKLYKEIINNPDGHSEADVKNANEQLASIQRGDSYATVYSSTFSNEDGTKSVVVTPILPDGTVLSPEELEDYANKLLAGEEIDPDINIKLAEFDGSNSIQKAGEYAQALHEAQAEYDLLRDTLKINTTIDEKGIEGLKEIKEIKSSITEKDDGSVVIDEDAFREALTGAEYTEDQIDVIIEKIKKLNTEAFNIDPFKIDETLTDKGVAGLEEIAKVKDSLTKDESTGLTVFDTDMFTSVLQEAGYTKDQIDELIKKIQDYNNIVSISGNADPLGLNNAGLNVESLKASLSTLGIAFEDTLGKWGDGKRDLTINVTDLVTTLKAKGWTDASIKEYINNLANNTNLDGFNVKVKGIENIDEVIQTASEVPEEKTTEYEVTGTGTTTLNGIDSTWDEVTKDKTTNYTINETTIKKTKEADANGTAVWYKPWTWGSRVDGTAHAGGSWGAPRTETALTGELGPEILVRNGRWTTVGENGAEFTQVKKGDIIFNHRQTEELLKNGHVIGRGKAYASGTAYTEGSGTFARYEFSGSGGYREYNVNDTVVESWGDLSGAIDKATDSLESASDASNEFAETFDWIEVRLEEINEDLDLMNAQLENAVGYSSQNSIIDSIIGTNKTKMSNLVAGIEKYSNYAARLLADVPAQYRAAAQDGSIAITEFAGEADEATVEAIENYREWAQKVADLKQQLEEVKTEIADLAKQKYDNVANEYDNIITLIENQNEKLEAQVDLMEDRGYVAATQYYTSMMAHTKDIQAELQKEKENLQAVLDEQVKLGNIDKYSDEWYEMVDGIYEVDVAIVKCTSDLESYQNAINDIYWDNFDELINRLDYLKNETQGLIDLMDSEDPVAHSDDRSYTEGGTKYWTADDVQWTEEGLASMGLYAQQMEIAEFKARQYAEAIDDLNQDYADGKYSESEYIDKLNKLTSAQYDSIEAYYDAQDAIIELNEARVDAIKEGIEKEIEAYEELIEKQKEELDAEKDLHDFQESVMEQQKNISDIERKLAALANDNSISATAKRKQLEAELAEAQYELEEMYYDRSVEDKQTALDQELESFQAEKDAEILKLEEYLTNVETVIADSLNIVQANAFGIYDTLNAKAEEYDLTLSDAVMTPWQDGALAVSDYQTTFDTAMSSTMDQLEAMKMEWQEIINKMMEAAGIEIQRQQEENNSYTASEYTPPVNTNPTPSAQPENQEKSITVGGKINASGATIYSNSSGGGANRQYYSSDPIYTVLDERNGYLKVRHHKLSSGVTGWFKKSDVKAYAKGTTGVNEDQWALIDELGEELVMHADANGRLAFLSKGSAVIPHDISENLMKLGELNPQDMIDGNRPVISAPHVVNNNIELNMEIAEVVHIDTVTNDTIPNLTKAIEKQMDKYVKKMNSDIRKYTR